MKDSHLQPDCLVEIKPTGKKTGEIVWEWRSWDHLIQDRDKTKPNYGNVSEHPELFDVNYIHGEEDQVSKMMATKDGLDKLRTLGYVGSARGSADAKKDRRRKTRKRKRRSATHESPTQGRSEERPDRGPRKNPDWMHVNAVAYNADLDQIALEQSPASTRSGSSTTAPPRKKPRATPAVAGAKGAISSTAGATREPIATAPSLDQRLFGQHNIQWIPKGLQWRRPLARLQ